PRSVDACRPTGKSPPDLTVFVRGGDLSKTCVPTRRNQREREQVYSLKLDHSPSIFFICSMTSRGCATTDLAMGSSSSPVFGSISNFLFLTSARKAGSLMVF